MKHLTHRDQLYKDIRYDPLGTALIDLPDMQRLGRVYQLGYTHLVYRGGTHTRLSHVLGVAHIAEVLVNALRTNYEVAQKDNTLPTGAILPAQFLPGSGPLSDRWEVLTYLVRWASLLHDIGHIPLGHTLEDEFTGIYEKHDSIDSPRVMYYWGQQTTASGMSLRDIFYNPDYYPESFNKVGIKPKDAYRIVMLICLYKSEYSNPELRVIKREESRIFVGEFFKAIDDLLGSKFHPYMADIVADTICADYIDYVVRDAVNTGLDYPDANRIALCYFVGMDAQSKLLRIALSLVDKHGKSGTGTYNAALRLIGYRFTLAEVIYYHKTKAAASTMLAKVFDLIATPKEVGNPWVSIDIQDIDTVWVPMLQKGEEGQRKITPVNFKRKIMPDSMIHPAIGDESLLLWLLDMASNEATDAAKSSNTEHLKKSLVAISLLQSLVNRKLYKAAISINLENWGELMGFSKVQKAIKPGLQAVVDKYRDFNGNARKELESDMLNSVNWPLGAILFYVPGLKSQAKGIETGALDHNGLTTTMGEHTGVQNQIDELNRSYSALWKFMVFVNPSYRTKEKAVELSKMTDTFLSRFFPNLNLTDDSSVSKIEAVCSFDYIPSSKREAALIYMKHCKESKKIDWKKFKFGVPKTMNGTTGSAEYVDRALLLQYCPADLIKGRFGNSGSLSKEIKASKAQLAMSFDGTAEIDQRLAAIEEISKALLNPSKL